MKQMQIFTLSALLMSAYAGDASSCGDREMWLEEKCQECPTWTRAQNDHAFCNSDQCDSKTQVVQTDGTCGNCPKGFEPDVNMVDCNKIDLVCEGNSARSGSKCQECPTYTRPQSNNSYCSPDYCDLNSIILPSGKCQKCEAGQKPDKLSRRQCEGDKSNETCNGRQIESADGEGKKTCQDCPEYTRAQQNNWYCGADMCNFDQIIRKDGTCLSCPKGDTPDAARMKCKAAPKAVVINAPASPQVQERPAAACEPSWQITKKDGSCAACPEYTRPTKNNECAGDLCGRYEFLHEWGYCLPCQKGWEHDRTGRKCEDKREKSANVLAKLETVQCSDRQQRSLDRTECFPCPDYSRAQDNNSKCAGDKCQLFEIQLKDGTCQKCSQGTRADFTQRQCVNIVDPTSCTDRQVFVEVMNMCEQCQDYTRPNGEKCQSDVCTSGQSLQKDGTCKADAVVCGSLEIQSKDGASCDKCFPYTRPQNNGSRCGQDDCPKGIVQWDGTCMDYNTYLTNLNALKQQTDKEDPEKETTKEDSKSSDNAVVAIISVLSVVVLGLIGVIVFQFRAGQKAVPPAPHNEVREIEVSVQQQEGGQQECGPTSKKLVLENEESFAMVDDEVPHENIQDSVQVPIAAKE